MFTDHRGHQRWRCWSGDDTHRGDAVDLVSITRRLSRGDAIAWLADRCGLAHGRDPIPTSALQATTQPATARIAPPLSPAVVDYARACARLLWTPVGLPVRRWLHERRLGDDVLRANHVGADPGRRRLHRIYGLPSGTTLAATFPVLGVAGDVRYVQARYLVPGDGPKFESPASRLGANPRLAWTKTRGRPRDDVLLVCEGIPDALSAAQAGYRSVALLGTHAATPDVVAQIAGFAHRHRLHVAAVIDADDAGRQAGHRLGDLFAGRGHQLHLIEPPDGHDLNSWVRRDPHWVDAVAAVRSSDRGATGRPRVGLDL